MNGRWTISLVVAGSIGYAVIRYIVFGDVPVRQLPLYVANKGAAMSSLLLLGMSLLARSRENRKVFGKSGFLLLAAHTVISIAILTPAYFPKYFHADGTFVWRVEGGLAFGVAGIVVGVYLFFAAPNGNGSSSLRRGVGRFILIASAIHTALLGYPTWRAIESWPGYLPPITLLATISAAVMLALRLAAVRDADASDTPR